jgi:hypothetical protein
MAISSDVLQTWVVDYIATCNIVAKVFVQNMSALFD